MARTESKVKDDQKKVLRSFSCWWYMPVQMGMGAAGVHDFITCIPVTITQDMVGKTVGMFMSVESKEEGLVAKLFEQAAEKHPDAHLSKCGRFVSNRPAQTFQADGIFAASGKAIVSDSAKQLENAILSWMSSLHSR